MSTTLIVGPSTGQRDFAVRHLVRSDEVAHFINYNGSYLDFRTFAEKVADWHASRFVRRETQYISDGPWDAWQSPAATLARRGGDCEDHTILVLSMLAHDPSVAAQFIVGELWTGRTWGGHAWVEGQDASGGFLIEATNGKLLRVRPEGYRVGQVITTSYGRRAA